MPVDCFDSDRDLENVENSAAPTARELGGRSAAHGGDINCFDVEALHKRKEIGAKRGRFIWTDELHQIFVDAVNILTIEKAVPKKILDYMKFCGVQNITRAIVASHLQKYRLNLKRRLEVDKVSKLPSQSISLNETKRRNQEENTRKQVLQEKIICEMKHHRWPLMESLLGPDVKLHNMFFPQLYKNNEHIPLLNLPNQFSGYVDGNNNNNNVIAPLINHRLSNHVSNDCHYLKILRQYEEAYKDYSDDNMHIKPRQTKL